MAYQRRCRPWSPGWGSACRIYLLYPFHSVAFVWKSLSTPYICRVVTYVLFLEGRVSAYLIWSSVQEIYLISIYYFYLFILVWTYRYLFYTLDYDPILYYSCFLSYFWPLGALPLTPDFLHLWHVLVMFLFFFLSLFFF